MKTIIPRYFQENRQLKELGSQKAFGVEFRFNNDITNYNIIATSHVLVFVLKGEKRMHMDTGDLVVKSGEWVFIPKGCYVSSELKSYDDEFRRLVLFFEDSFLNEFLKTISFSDNVKKRNEIFATSAITPLLNQAIKSLRSYLDGELQLKESLMKNKLYEILLNVIESDSEKKILSLLRKVLASPKIDLKNFMDDNYNLPLSVAEFSKLACRSERQFNRDFKTLFNESPNSWIKNRRLEFSYQQLLNTNKSISDICYDSGFKNYSNFIQNFRRKYDITPKKLRAES